MSDALCLQRLSGRVLAFAAGTVLAVSPVIGQTKAQPQPATKAPAQPVTAQPQPGSRPAQPSRPATGTPQGNAPATPPAAPPAPLPDPEQLQVAGSPDMVTLSAFAEPVAMTTLIDLVATTLEINVTVVGDPPGTVRFNAPVPVKKSELIFLLQTLLEQQGWTIVRNQFGLYTVQEAKNIPTNMRGSLSTTRVIRTPNMRPTTIKPFIDGLVGAPPSQPGGTPRSYAYIDDLGVIIATDTPVRLDAVAQIVDQIVAEDRLMEFHRLPLDHITATVARDRALQLLGQMQQSLGQLPQGGGRAPAGDGANAAVQRNLSQLYGLPERLTVDQQGNALIYRGSTEELTQVQRVLSVIDVPNELVPRVYRAGRAALQVADIARGRGLGEVITISALDTGLASDQNRFNLANPGAGARGGSQTQTTPSVGGPLMVVDENRGQIIYYATTSQQDQLKRLLEQLDTDAEVVVTQVFKLSNSSAEDIAEILNGIISNSAFVGSAPLLPGDEGGQGRRGSRVSTPRQNMNQPRQPNAPAAPNVGGEEGFALTDENAFVFPDVKNNQIIVKAQAGQQPEFARLIDKLDLRRPQVFVEAKIVAVTASDSLRTAFETQLINANGTGGVFTQAFGLATYGAGGILAKPTVNALTGFTAAVIKNDMVPFVMTALANETDSRIISSPQLLVDNNEEATVVSLDQQPTSTVRPSNNSGGGDIVTFGDYAEAGTTLTVKPQISEAGYLRLAYDIQLSSFTGEANPDQGLPPPRLENSITSDSVTIPSDSTVVVGGLVVNTKTKTVAKIPLLGDVPLAGILFQDRSTGDRKTVLYIFLTPKVLRDPNFRDLKLLTRGPRERVGLPPDVAPMTPSTMDILAPGAVPPPAAPMPVEPEQDPAQAVSRTGVVEPRRRATPETVPPSTEPPAELPPPSTSDEPNPD